MCRCTCIKSPQTISISSLPFPQIYRLMKNCWEAEASFRPAFQNLVPVLRAFHEKYKAQAPSVFSLC